MPSSSEIPFSYIEQNFMLVPVRINDSITTNFILDTGIGINLISKTLCEQLQCPVQTHHRGKRMSGQEVTVPMTKLSSLSLGDLRQTDVLVGIFDMDRLMPGANIGGFLSLGFFATTAFTVDDKRQMLIFENPESLKKLMATGATTPVQVNQQGASLAIRLPLALPNGQTISVEVDSGSQALILDEKYMDELSIGVRDKGVTHKKGQDETGHSYDRYFTTLQGPVHLPTAPQFKVDDMKVMFQKIIYQGLVGQYFLRTFTVTYDLANSRMIFNKP